MQLHDYQVVARDFLRGRNRAALFLDMGLGKTATCLSALEPRHLPVLVVAPKRVAEHVWPSEQRTWRPELQVSLAAGNPATRKAALESSADIVVLGRDNLRDALPYADRFRTVIIDELSGFKDRGSQRWKTAKRLTATTPHVWGLTGTPAPNGLGDLWAQVYLLDGGERLSRTLTAFRERFFRPGKRLATGVVVSYDLRPGCDRQIYGLIDDICLSMKSEGRIVLPPITYNQVSVSLPPRVRRAYDQIKDTLVADLRDIFGGEIHSAANAAVLTSKLSQIAAGFLYVDDADLRGGDYTKLHQEKVDAVREVVDGTGGSPVMVFYRFRAERDMLTAAFPEAVDVRATGAIDRWNSGGLPMLLAHPASAGHGLNLQAGGHTAVWTSLPWELEHWEQGNARLHRQRQANPVVIHSLMADSTIDHLIRARLDGKVRVEDSLMAHLESPI